MFPIFGALATHKEDGYFAAKVIAFYAPYAIIPAALAIVMALNPRPWGHGVAEKRKER